MQTIQKKLAKHLLMSNLILITVIPVLMLTIPNVYGGRSSNKECPKGYHENELCVIDYNPCEDDGIHYLNTNDVCVSNLFCVSNPNTHEYTLPSKPHTLSMVDCDEKPDSSLCNGERGVEGSIFCDVQYQETGKKSSCYDRNDNTHDYWKHYEGKDPEFCAMIEEGNEEICLDDGYEDG